MRSTHIATAGGSEKSNKFTPTPNFIKAMKTEIRGTLPILDKNID